MPEGNFPTLRDLYNVSSYLNNFVYCDEGEATPTPTPGGTPTAVPTQTPTPIATPTPVETPTPTVGGGSASGAFLDGPVAF